MRSTWLVLICACAPGPAAAPLPAAPGLHLVAPFAPGGEAAAERLAQRLPGIAANALALRAELATADPAAYQAARQQKSALVAGIAEQLPLDRPVWIFLLPAELRPTNLPETTDGGVVLLADESEDMVVWRVLRGVALTHPALPAEGTLLADVARGGVASRFAISEVQTDALAGDSPFVPYPPEMVAQRLPHLLAMVIHHPGEPKTSYRSGWVQRPDLELLGWLGTAELGQWRAWAGAGPAYASDLEGTVLDALEERAKASDQAARPEGFFASDFALQLAHDGETPESMLVTYKRGMALLRVHRSNVRDRAARVLGRVDADSLQRFLEALEALELATLTDHHDVTLGDDAVRFRFTGESAAGSLAFGFERPYPTDDERYARLVAAFDTLVAEAEGRK